MKTSVDLAQSAKDTVQQLATDAQAFVHEHPQQAAAAAVGIALGWHLLPTRLLFRTLAVAASGLAKPTLLAFGALKAFEIYRSSHRAQPEAAFVPISKHPVESGLVIIP